MSRGAGSRPPRVEVRRARGRRWWVIGVALAGLAEARPSSAGPLRDAANAITELDVARAAELLATVEGDAAAVAIERARLALYRGDCLSAAVGLDAVSTLAEVPEAEGLRTVARTCAQATAGALVVEDAERGIWIRLQDSRDRALVPFVVDTAARARDSFERELRVTMPRPLRIELVSDLFSLSALSGLPVEAAETTGTVGVARWGRVILVSPRATWRGYPWEDTLAHELVHLFVTRATRDRAPLWLQEGTAKQLEARWRAPRPFDDDTDPDAAARLALLSGRSVGIDGLGQSIAMLPSPELAATAYSEVTSFVGYLRHQTGLPATRLLFADLRGIGAEDPTPAMRSVTGYDLATWQARWRTALLADTPATPPPTAPVVTAQSVLEVRDLVRRVRLGELLAHRGHPRAASEELGPAVAAHPSEASVRWRASRAALDAGRPDAARELLGGLGDIDSVHGGWFGLHGRFSQEANDAAESERSRQIAVAVDPLLEDVACLGRGRAVSAVTAEGPSYTSAPLPESEPWRGLCLAARAAARD